jgi:predicted AlkP superfamily phosphohydrolase/phosphomutase
MLFEGHRAGRADLFIDDMRSFDIQRAKAVSYLVENKEWDFFTFVFEAMDTLQHELWHLMDETHPRHDPVKATGLKAELVRFYRDIDRALGDIISSAGEETLVIVMSDHGFGPFHRFFHVNNWLRELGLLRVKRTPVALLKYSLFRMGLTPVNVLKLVSALRLSNLRRRVKRGRGRGLLRKLFLSFGEVDWSRTQAFAVGNFGQVYINETGTRSQGCVKPGSEYEAIRDRIAQAALELRDPETGDQVIKYAHRREDIYTGHCLKRMPDIILHTDRSKYVSFGHADFGSNRVIEPSYGQTGHHNMTGILVMRGNGIRKGTSLNGGRIIDLAPTVLYAMGIPVPSDMDGRVLTEAFSPEYLANNPLTYTDVSSAGDSREEDYGAEDEEMVVQRLRGLGYIA